MKWLPTTEFNCLRHSPSLRPPEIEPTSNFSQNRATGHWYASSIGEYAEQDKVINADSTIIVLIIHLISQDGKNGKDKDVLFILNMVWSGLIWSGKISRMIWFQLGLMSTRMIHVIYVCIYAYILLQKCTMSRLFLKHTHTMWKSNAVFYLGIIGNTNF